MPAKTQKIVLAVSSTALFLYIFYLFRRKSSFRNFARLFWNPWVKVGHVSQLFVHPVKGGRGLCVSEAQCTEWGLKSGESLDRHFILVNAADGEYINDKGQPKLVLLRCFVENGELVLNAPDVSEFRLGIQEILDRKELRTAKLYAGRPVQGLDCGDAVAKWFEDFLKPENPVRLLHFVAGLGNESPKEAKKPWSGHLGKRRDKTAYAYVTPFMLMSESSVADLNTRLEKQVNVRNFRGNIVVTGSKPYDEDNWQEVKIGDTRFSYILPCTRCVITTVDTKTGEKDGSFEPLGTMRKYRLASKADQKYFGYSPVLGAHLGIDKTGTINVGDTVYARYRTPQ